MTKTKLGKSSIQSILRKVPLIDF